MDLGPARPSRGRPPTHRGVRHTLELSSGSFWKDGERGQETGLEASGRGKGWSVGTKR